MTSRKYRQEAKHRGLKSHRAREGNAIHPPRSSYFKEIALRSLRNAFLGCRTSVRFINLLKNVYTSQKDRESI